MMQVDIANPQFSFEFANEFHDYIQSQDRLHQKTLAGEIKEPFHATHRCLEW